VTVSGQLVTLAIDPLGRFLYASACGTSCDTTSGQPDQVFAFRIDSSTGALTAAGTAATGAFPRTAVVDALGNHLYVTCGPDGTADVISAFDINTSTGGLTAITGPFTTGNLPFGAAIPPGDSVLVTGDRTDNTIRAWRIGGNGGLTLATGSPVTPTPTMDYEHGVFSDPSGKFIYVLDADNDQIRIFTVSSAGALAETTGSQVPTVGFPTSLAVGH
jgi:6-phosphogluconolactonase (cycloisomerase 2 family)